MNINKTKYKIAVAVIVIATAFCGCGGKDDEIIPLRSIDETVPVPAAQSDLSEKGDDDIRVYVCGAVNKSDVYTVERNLRLIDAVNVAGGFAPDAAVDYLNLAAPLSDGQKIYIPTCAEIEEALAEGDVIYSSEVNITSNSPGLSSPTGDEGFSQNTLGRDNGTTGGLVNINSADLQTLMTLPGIGQSKAEKIIAYRETNGGFSSIEDIMLVGGIKEGMFNKIKDSICVR